MIPIRRQEIILFLGSLVLVVCAWIFFNIYHNSVSSTIPDVLNIQIIPIQPRFDTKTLQNLKERKKVTPVIDTQASSPSATPSPTISITSTPTPTATATSSGGLSP